MGRLTHRTGEGFTYFVTTKCWENRAIFRVRENAAILIECMLRYRDQGSFLLHEFVIMPNHLHLILTPDRDTSLERAMQLIKGGSSYEIHQRRELKLQIWQPGFHEESIRDLGDYERKAEYIHMNPVRARLADRPEDWAHGSANRRWKMDAPPDRLKNLASAAKAAVHMGGGMSDLKVRPPKDPGEMRLKSGPPENLSARPSAAEAAVHMSGGMSDLKVRPPKNLKLRSPKKRNAELKSWPPEGGGV